MSMQKYLFLYSCQNSMKVHSYTVYAKKHHEALMMFLSQASAWKVKEYKVYCF